MARKNVDDPVRGDFPVPAGEVVGNEYITPGLRRDARPEQVRLPNIDEMRDLSNGQLIDILEHFGVVQPWETMVANASSYVARLTELRPGTEEFRAEVERITSPQIGIFQTEVGRIVDAESRRGLLSLSRRTAQAWSSLDAIDGNVSQEMIWITEGDDHVCESCVSRGGTIMTYAEWQDAGPPGASVCLGGDQCRCDLVAVG
jgi:hypothetical protein